MNARILLSTGIAAAALVLSAGAALAVEAQAAGSANVRSGPGTSYQVVDSLSSGEIVDVVECNSSNTWCRIEHSGPDGWVSRSLLEAAEDNGNGGGPNVEFGMNIPLPGGGFITFGTPGYEPPPTPGPAKQVCVYDLPNYGGASICAPAGTSATAVGGFWNDRVTSLRVFGGAHIRLCQNINYGGGCNVFSTNVPALGATLNNKASSYQVW